MRYLVIASLIFLMACADIGQDKYKHALAGAGISAVVTEATGEPIYGVGSALAAGVVKETVDKNNGGKFDIKDIAATMLGSIFVWSWKF